MKKMMKNVALSIAIILPLAGCSSESNSPDGTSQTTQQSLTKIEHSYVLPNTGAVKVVCEYDTAGNEHCSGVYESSGQAVPDDVVRELVEYPIIDENIEKNVKKGCENKVFILTCVLRDEYPNAAVPEPGNPDSAKNREFWQKKQESRSKAMDAFVADNPGLLSDSVIQNYLSSGYGFEIRLNACDYDAFIKKNKYKIYILELNGVVDRPPVSTCSQPIDYAILRNDNLSSGKAGNKGEYHIFKDAESYHAFIDSHKSYYDYDGFDFESMAAKYKSISDVIDFSKYNILTIQTESGSGSVRLRVMKACNGQIEVDQTWCEGRPMTADEAYPGMIVRIPKGDYQISIGSKGLACDDNGNPLSGFVPEQKEDIQELNASENTQTSCPDAVQYSVLQKVNLYGTGEDNWRKQTAHPIHDMDSLKSYLDTLRARHLGESFDGKDGSVHYVFDDYPEKYKNFDFETRMMVALEGGAQPSGGYDMRVKQVCGSTLEYDVTWCDDPEVGYTADIGYPFMLINLPKGIYEYKGGKDSHYCK